MRKKIICSAAALVLCLSGTFAARASYDDYDVNKLAADLEFIEHAEEFIKNQGLGWQCNAPQLLWPNENVDTYSYGKGSFDDAYVLDIDNDGQLELIAFFANRKYGEGQGF